MDRPIIEIKDLCKVYRLGNLGARSFAEDISNIWKNILQKSKRKDSTDNLDSKQNNHSRFNPQCNNEFWALRNINMDFQPGEVVGIIGHNGAGKSTLLKILSRITEPSKGEVVIRGRVSSLLEVGTGFHPDLTGRENTYLNGTLHGMSRREIDQVFDEIIDFAQINEFIDTPVKRYSSGMYVRLAFSVAAHLKPEILIVDEVLAVGDADFQGRCLRKMKEISSEGRTVIFVSHIMTSVKALCSKCYLLKEGIIKSVGDTGSIIEEYLASDQNLGNNELLDQSSFSCNTGAVVIKSIMLLNFNGTRRSSFHFMEDIKIVINIECPRSIDGILAAVYLNTKDGVAISFGCSNDNGNSPYTLPEGCCSLEIEAKACLLPGEYCIKASIFQESGSSICVVERACDFKVEKIAKEESNNYKWERSNAYTHLNTNWRIVT